MLGLIPQDQTARLTRAGVVAGVFALSGCGGGSSPDATFKKAYAGERTVLNGIATQVGGVLTESSDAALLGQLNALEPRYRTELDHLDTLKPPASVEASYNAMKAAARGLDADLMRIAATVSAHDGPGAGAATRQLTNDIPVLKSAATIVRKQLGLPPASGQ